MGYISFAECLRLSSNTVTQCASEAAEFGEKTHNNGHFAFQGRRFWYQLKAHIRFPISDQYQLTSYLAPFRRYSIPNVKNRYTWLALLRLNPPTEGFPRTICVKFSANVNRWSRYQMANEFSVVNIAFL